jgi:hypothetical protein
MKEDGIGTTYSMYDMDNLKGRNQSGDIGIGGWISKWILKKKSVECGLESSGSAESSGRLSKTQ